MNASPNTPLPPLAYRLSASIPKPKVGIEEGYKAIRNRLRRYSATSIVDLALHMLWNPPGDPLKELQSAPWLTLLIVKWALQDNGVAMRIGPRIPPQEMDLIRQQLWDLPGNTHDANEDRNVFLMLRALFNVQWEFQRNGSWGFLRWPALYARLHRKHKCRQQFRVAFGMEPNAFLDLTFGLYAAVLGGDMPFNGDWLSPWRSTYGQDVDRIYGIFVRDLISLRTELQKEPAERIRGKHELSEFPYLKRFPLVRLRDGRLHCWHRLVFARGVEEVVHLRLSEQFGEEYTRSFSRIFESYVTELASDTGKPHMTEAAYKDIVGGDAPAVEVIFEGADCNIFVEAKMSFFADDVLLPDNEKVMFYKTKRVRDGISQGWRVGKVIREHSAFGARFDKAQDFLLVVTSRELIIGGGQMLQSLYSPGTFDYPDEEAAKRLPLCNVFVVSIEDFEHTMGCVKAGEVDLSALLKEAAAANQRGDTARMFFADFLSKYTKVWSLSPVLMQARRDAEMRMVAAFGGASHEFD